VRLAAEKAVVIIVGWLIFFVVFLTAYYVLMMRLEKVVPWVATVFVLWATLCLASHRLGKRWKRLKGE
jgi:hypothetical protein